MALDSYEKERLIAANLVAREPTPFRRRSLSISYGKVVTAYAAQKRYDEARKLLNARLTDLNAELGRNPEDALVLRDLARCYRQQADLEELPENWTGVVEARRQQAKILDKLEANNVGDGVAEELVSAYGNLAWAELLAGLFQQATDDAKRALAKDPSQAWIKINLAHGLLFTGQVSDAKALYFENKDNMNGRRKLSEDVKSDFAALCRRNYKHPAMAEILQTLGITGAQSDPCLAPASPVGP